MRIAPSPHARLLALGLDDAGRVQYLYHPTFRGRQDREKFRRIEHFGEYLPNLRRVTNEDLTLPGLPKRRVVAIVLRLINRLYFRVGSPQGVTRYRTYGVTTLRNQHLRDLGDGRLAFSFDGKSHVHQRRLLVDEDLARALEELKRTPGPCLFKYLDERGSPHAVRARDVNDYIKDATAPGFSAKDFRTWAGTLLVAKELGKLGRGTNERDSRRKIAQAVRAAATELGNTPAVCRRSYLHPGVLRAYLHDPSFDEFTSNGQRIQTLQEGYTADELALLDLFQRARSRRSTQGATDLETNPSALDSRMAFPEAATVSSPTSPGAP